MKRHNSIILSRAVCACGHEIKGIFPNSPVSCLACTHFTFAFWQLDPNRYALIEQSQNGFINWLNRQRQAKSKGVTPHTPAAQLLLFGDPHWHHN